MSISDIQRKLKSILLKLSETDNDDEKCKLLIDLKPIVEGQFDNSIRLTVLSEVWRYGIPQAILSFLREKDNLLSESTIKACYLCSIVVECCIGYTLEITLMNEFVPDLTYTILQTLSRMVTTYVKVEKRFQPTILGNISWVVMIIGKIMERFASSSINMISSKHFMQILMEEDPSISLIALSFLKSILKINRNIFYHVVESRAHSIVEELTFKLFGTADNSVAKVSLSVLLILLEVHPALLGLFTTKRYRGFKTYVTKLQGKGCDDEIRKMLLILENQSKRLLASQKEEYAAIVIQSCYKGYKLRKRLANAVVAIAKFQKMYRKRQTNNYEKKIQEKLRKTRTQCLDTDRRKAFIDSKVKQLKIIENIPAKTVNKFLEDYEENAAKKIQALWRGHRIRKLIEQLRPEMKRERAAITIQKHVRKWLLRSHSKHVSRLIDLVPAGLNDQRKVELQNVLGNIRDRFPISCKSDAELSALHEKSFRLLNNHMMRLHQTRRQDERSKALMAQLSVLSNQLAYFPSLATVDLSRADEYASYSTPIIVAARQKHLDCLNEQKIPWWKKMEGDSFENKTSDANSFFLNGEKQF